MATDKPTSMADAAATLIRSSSGVDEATFIAKQTSLGHSLPGRAIGEVEVGAEVKPAREVGRYQVLEKLGEGAMAVAAD